MNILVHRSFSLKKVIEYDVGCPNLHFGRANLAVQIIRGWLGGQSGSREVRKTPSSLARMVKEELSIDYSTWQEKEKWDVEADNDEISAHQQELTPKVNMPNGLQSQ